MTPPAKKTPAKKTPAKKSERTSKVTPPTNRMLSTTDSNALTDKDFEMLNEHFANLRLKASAEDGIRLEAAAAGAATAGNKIRGYEGQMYYAVGGATETLFANVVDFDLDVKVDSIDATDRSTVGWKDKFGGLKEWTGTVKANSIQNGVDLIAFFAALTGGLTLQGSFRPQDIAAGLAFTGTFVITGFKYSSPGTGLQTLDLTIEGRGALVLGTVTTAGS